MVVFHTYSIKLTGEIWDVWINCKGSKERWVKANVDKGNIRFETLISIKEQLGFGLRDYLYYKKRCGNDIASLEAIDYRRDAECMIRDVASEKKVRLVLATQQVKERHVNITPLK